MAKTFIIYKDLSGFRFRDSSLNIPGGYIPKSCQTAEQMRQYLGKGQRVDLVFRTPSGQPMKHYNIKRGSDFATVDFEKRMTFNFKADVIEFLKGFAPEDALAEESKVIDLDRKIELLKRNVSEETLSELQAFIAAKQSDDNLKSICMDHSKKYFNQDNVSVEFVD